VNNTPKVLIDWNRCSGKGTCIEVCPFNVFELQEIENHPETLKAVAVRIENCTLCMKCIPACVEDAIIVEGD
jgi:NAD-dependent dihydropyrimidine dehydrogenase PreA subunit